MNQLKQSFSAKTCLKDIFGFEKTSGEKHSQNKIGASCATLIEPVKDQIDFGNHHTKFTFVKSSEDAVPALS